MPEQENQTGSGFSAKKPDPVWFSDRRIGVLISGRGSNLQALIDAVADGRLDARIAVVIANDPTAGGLDRARQVGIEAIAVSHRGWPSRDDFDRALARELTSRNVALVCLAGFMRVVGAPLLDAFPDAILNIHPVAAAVVPRRRRATPGPRARRQGHRCDGALGRQGSGCRSDRPAAHGRSSRRRHARHIGGAHPRGGASHLSGSDSAGAGRRLADRWPAFRSRVIGRPAPSARPATPCLHRSSQIDKFRPGLINRLKIETRSGFSIAVSARRTQTSERRRRVTTATSGGQLMRIGT